MVVGITFSSSLSSLYMFCVFFDTENKGQNNNTSPKRKKKSVCVCVEVGRLNWCFEHKNVNMVLRLSNKSQDMPLLPFNLPNYAGIT